MQTKMMMTDLFMTLFAVFAALFVSVGAVPTALQARDVYDPPVLSPGTGTVWRTGQLQNVTWDVSDPPQQITNPIGKVYLVQGDNLVRASPDLASGFNILVGHVEVTVPEVPTGIYQMIVFGDSGNAGGAFVIVGDDV